MATWVFFFPPRLDNKVAVDIHFDVVKICTEIYFSLQVKRQPSASLGLKYKHLVDQDTQEW